MSRYRNIRPYLQALSREVQWLPQYIVEMRRSMDRSARLRRTTVSFRLERGGFASLPAEVIADLLAPKGPRS